MSTGISLPYLTSLDPYGDTMFTRQEAERIGGELETLMRQLESFFQHEALPPDLEPPPAIELETDPVGEPCGRAGVLRFLSRLRCLFGNAVKDNLPVWALGD